MIKKVTLLFAACFVFACNVNAQYCLNDGSFNNAFNEWFTDGTQSSSYTIGDDGLIIVNVPKAGNDWDVELCNILCGNKGQEVGAKFTFECEVYWESLSSYDTADIHLLTGKIGWSGHDDWQFSEEDNTELVTSNAGGFLGYVMNQSRKIPKNEWTKVSWGDELVVGEKGANYIGIQINLTNSTGTNIGNFHFRNIVIRIGKKTTREYALHKRTIGNLKYILYDNLALVEGLATNVTSVTIPEVVICENDEYQVVRVNSSAFRDCSNLQSITIPKSVTDIGDYAFSGCSGLTSIVIPDSVTAIGGYAFSDCSSLKSITFGSAPYYIGDGVLSGCGSLENIVCKSKTPPYVNRLTSSDMQEVFLCIRATLTYPLESSDLYRNNNYWRNFIDAPKNITGNTVVYDSVFVYDTVYQILSKKDTVCLADNNEKHKLTATSANTKMGIAYGSGVVVSGSQTEIVAIEKYGYHFTQWSDGNTDNPRFVDVTSDSTFTAQFEVNNYTVLAEANEKEMGKVEGAAEYAYLSRTQLNAVPNTGYKFAAWSDGATENPRDILVYCDTTFTAVFEVAGTESVTAIDESDAQINIYAIGNTIVVENATDEIFVYSVMGVLVGRGEASIVSTITINNSGVYIVKTSETVKRVVVN